jgi:hypothetical protein
VVLCQFLAAVARQALGEDVARSRLFSRNQLPRCRRDSGSHCLHEFYARVRSELSLHRLPLQIWPRVLHRKLYYTLAMFLERKIYRNTRARLVAVSSLVAGQLKSHFQRGDVTVIPNAVDSLRFTAEARMEKKKCIQ